MTFKSAFDLEVNSASRGLIEQCEILSSLLQAHGLTVLPYSEKSLNQVQSLDPYLVEQATQGLRFYNAVVQSSSIPLQSELHLIEKTFDLLRCRPKKDDWQHLFRPGLLVEIYNLEMVQIYRNFEFFKQCSYDLLTLVSFPWDDLYLRPSSVTKALFNRAHEILKSSKTTTTYDLPSHVLKENTPGADRVFMVEMLTLTPLLDESEETRFFLHFVESTPIAQGPSAEKVALL